MDVGPHALYVTEVLHGSRITAATAAMLYDHPGVDAVAFCEFRLTSGGIANVQVGWRHGEGAIAVYGSEGHLEVVFDERVGYFGAAARAIRHFAERANPPGLIRFRWATPWWILSSIATSQRHFRARATSTRRMVRTGARIEVTLAAYAADARRSWIELPLAPDDPVYQRGVAALL